ncbi:hypothetical protein [Sorangium sp. So ce117]|uniref:hypothetical protein n=1 Tax=Sorangium sp. So ce117 TaxID=3133277 RepID=UPI003F5EAC6E
MPPESGHRDPPPVAQVAQTEEIEPVSLELLSQAPVLPWAAAERGPNGAPRVSRLTPTPAFHEPVAPEIHAVPIAVMAPLPLPLALPTATLAACLTEPLPPSPPPVPTRDALAPAPEDASPWTRRVTMPALTVGQLAEVVERTGRNATPVLARHAEIAASELRSPPPARKPSTEPPAEIVELLWFEAKALPRIRASWSDVILDLDFEALDPRHDLPAGDAGSPKDHHHLAGLLTHGTRIEPSGVPQAILASISEKGRFTPPLVLVEGELRFVFDEIEALKATLAVVAPLAGADRSLKEAVDLASELLSSPYPEGATGAAVSLTQQIKERLPLPSRPLAAARIETQAERLLLEQRRYQTRTVLGDTWIRALLGAGGQDALPVYLPKRLAPWLPMLPRLRVRLVAEAHLRQDQAESSRVALKAFALGRIASLEEIQGGRL